MVFKYAIYLEAIRVNYVLFDDCVPTDMAELAHFASALVYEKDNANVMVIFCNISQTLYLIFIDFISLQNKFGKLKKKKKIQLKMLELLELRNMW